MVSFDSELLSYFFGRPSEKVVLRAIRKEAAAILDGLKLRNSVSLMLNLVKYLEFLNISITFY